MIPVHRTSDWLVGCERWPRTEKWDHRGLVIGVGADSGVLVLVPSRESGDRMLVHRVGSKNASVVLDGALRADFVQPLPGGRTLLVAARAEPGTSNAQVWDDAGRLVASAFVGDAIEHVLTTAAGSIWVGYFDEASDELGLHKLVRLDSNLRPQWCYPHSSERDLPWVFDVVALNVHGETALCYAHADFHLVQVQADSVTDLGPTGVRGARAVVVDGFRGALIGGYGAEYDLVTPFAVQPGGRLDVGAPIGRLVLPDGRERDRLRFTARGAELTATDDGLVRYRVSVDELLDGPHF